MNAFPSYRRSRGFSMIEMMVALGLLSLVILVLFSLFNQTTKAMRANVNQTDVMEGARSSLELISRELESMSASGLAGAPNFVSRLNNPNPGREFLADSANLMGPSFTPLFYDLFFLQRVDTKRVKVQGFIVRDEFDSAKNSAFPVGTLYIYQDPASDLASADLRYTRPNDLDQLPIVLTAPDALARVGRRLLDRTLAVQSFGATKATDSDGYTYLTSRTLSNCARIVDGVVSFRVTTYDQLGRPLDPSIWNYPDADVGQRSDPKFPPQPPKSILMDFVNVTNNFARTGSSIFIMGHWLANDTQRNWATEFVDSVFLGEQLPRTVEIELALLEPRALDQYRALPGITVALPNGPNHPRQRYLRNNLGKIQIFRQRVPIRAANR